MALIDRRLRGKGYPGKVILQPVDDKIESMNKFLDGHIQAEILMTKFSFIKWSKKYWKWIIGLLVSIALAVWSHFSSNPTPIIGGSPSLIKTLTVLNYSLNHIFLPSKFAKVSATEYPILTT